MVHRIAPGPMLKLFHNTGALWCMFSKMYNIGKTQKPDVATTFTQFAVSFEGKRMLFLCKRNTVRTADCSSVELLKADRKTSEGIVKDTGWTIFPSASAKPSGSKRTDEVSLSWSCICKARETLLYCRYQTASSNTGQVLVLV